MEWLHSKFLLKKQKKQKQLELYLNWLESYISLFIYNRDAAAFHIFKNGVNFSCDCQVYPIYEMMQAQK